MTVWQAPVSWSKFKLALHCQRQLQFTLDYTPPSFIQQGFYQGLGKAVQKTFELFYNQGLWKRPETRTTAVLREVTRRVLLHREHYDEGIIFNEKLTREALEQEIYSQVESGRQFLEAGGLLQKQMKSEQGWGCTFRNLRLYGMIDFLRSEGNQLCVYDGKGSQQKDADPRQVVYYALILRASGYDVKEGALIYWKHGVEKVDVSLKAVREFVETDFMRGSEVFQVLKSGVRELPANPSEKECTYCPWKLNCKDSLFYSKEYVPEGCMNMGG